MALKTGHIFDLFIGALRPIAIGYLLFVLVIAVFQRRILYHPGHHDTTGSLSPWNVRGETWGFKREGRADAPIWLMLHGIAGQASDRTYALPCFPSGDSVYVMEYPGFGVCAGESNKDTIDDATLGAYVNLRVENPGRPIYVVGESLGSGPASMLCTLPKPPDKLFLVVPYDRLIDVAAEAVPFIPVRHFFLDKWDNISALSVYSGPVEIFASIDDKVISFGHAQALAQSLPRAQLHVITGGHSAWAAGGMVNFGR